MHTARLGAIPLVLCTLLAAEADAPTRQEIDSAMQELAAQTGFQVRRPVQFQAITRKQVSRFLEERIKKDVKSDELRAEELTLKKFGFVPQDFDLRKGTLDLLTEQTAAFYDFHRKKLYITDWAASELRDAALVHELAHALADQNFSLERYSRQVENDAEQSIARQAVVEGQASWLMQAILTKRDLREGREAEDTSTPVFDKAPLYFQETLLFPYNQGAVFQQAVVARLGRPAFAEVFRRPPVSTQQVMHPDLYFEGVTPLDVSLPELKGLRKLVEGPMGELDNAILLRQYCEASEADAAAARWRGGKYRLWEDSRSKRVVLVYHSAWNNPSAAQRFWKLYGQVMEGKWKNYQVSAKTAERVSGRGDDGYFQLYVEGSDVWSWEGFEGPFPL